MKPTAIFVLSLLLFLTACSGNNIYIDKSQKAIISKNGSPLAKVMIDGAGTEITLIAADNSKDNSAIYFNRHNPGFLVSDGFGLNKNYYLELKPHTRYTVSCYTSDKGQSPTMINFRTDYNTNIVLADEDN
ncbi:MAG TPA: hypothetical protein VG367_16910 [Mucilaginibacter sp.]|jgi:hypothetical protein|nr:hypothetical protein [Mucilaginibacter sp.]